MKQIIESGGAKVCIDNKFENMNDQIIGYAKQHIPLSQIETSGIVDYNILISEGKGEIQVKDNSLEYTGELNKNLFAMDIVCVLSGLFENLYTQKGIFSLHSAAVEKDGKAIILA